MAINGSCSCGNVNYRVDGELREAGSCHCSMCRKMSGSQSSAYAMLEPEEFSWISGEDQLSLYKSSDDMGEYFCSNCGSTLCGTYKGDMCWVALGCIDGDPGVKVGKHIYMGSKASWETNPDDVEQYEESAGNSPQ